MGFFRRIFGGGASDDIFGDSSVSSALKLTSEGNYHGGEGNLDRAIACYEKAISTKPDHTPAHLGLATAYREKGEYQRALDVLSSAPSEADAGGEAMDFVFEIAFYKATVLIAKYKRTRFRGEMPDLVAALEEAREIGCDADHRVTDSTRRAARALGIDVDAERQEMISMIETLLSEIPNQER